jgi:hypothetical protein
VPGWVVVSNALQLARFCCGFSDFMSNCQVKCPLDVQMDIKVGIQPSLGIGAPAVGPKLRVTVPVSMSSRRQ